jgi:hypothetical protein
MGASADTRVGGSLTPGQGPGWAELAKVVAQHVPPAEIEAIYVFRPSKRDGREWGTAVITRRAEGEERLRVYTARYMLIVRGKERGRSRVEVKEVALSPADVLDEVMRTAADRTSDAEPPVMLERSVWYEG